MYMTCWQQLVTEYVIGFDRNFIFMANHAHSLRHAFYAIEETVAYVEIIDQKARAYTR